jgi:hypothetical protein
MAEVSLSPLGEKRAICFRRRERKDEKLSNPNEKLAHDGTDRKPRTKQERATINELACQVGTRASI